VKKYPVYCPVLCLLASLVQSFVRWLVGASSMVFPVFHPSSGLPGGVVRCGGVLSGLLVVTIVFALYTLWYHLFKYHCVYTIHLQCHLAGFAPCVWGSVNLTAYNVYPVIWTPLEKWFVK
jgi:hypothetical protein